MLSADFLMGLAQALQEHLQAVEKNAINVLRNTAEHPSGAQNSFSIPHILAGYSEQSGKSLSESMRSLLHNAPYTLEEVAERLCCTVGELKALLSPDACRPNKETLVALCLSLQLSLNECVSFLDSVGYSFSDDEVYDQIVLYCIREGVYSIPQVNEALACFNLKPIVPRFS